MKNNQQNRMISLAIPIGILSLVLALLDVFDLIKLWLEFNISDSSNRIITICSNILTFILFIMLIVWFLSLFKGSLKNSKLRIISVIAILGILLFMAYGSVLIGTDLLKLQGPSWLDNRVVQLGFALKFFLFGSAFCTLSKFFQDKMKTIALLAGTGFLLRWILGSLGWIIGVDYISPNTYYILIVIASLFCYLFLAWFFFGFSNTSNN